MKINSSEVSTEGGIMSTRITVCNACCCGNVAKGNKEVPVQELRQAWKDNDLGQNAKLTISSCLGPCSHKNVVLITNQAERTWLGGIDSDEQYQEIIDWAVILEKQNPEAKLPGSLSSLKFNP